jgi:GMP synthase-like glutamine amidotransferase
MTPEINHQQPEEPFDSLPFPYSQRPYCPYEPVERRVDKIRVLVVNDLLRDESDLSETARREWGETAAGKLERERYVSGLAIDNIVNNIKRLVVEPEVRVAHLSEAAEAAEEFKPEAIVLSGTLSDFDFYSPEMLRRFAAFAVRTTTPILGICGGHQLIGLCFGVGCVTLDNAEPGERRDGRSFEYQYRFIRMTEPADPIFEGLHQRADDTWYDYTADGNILRVWQNHGLQLPRLPEGFKLLATSYLCRNQMMVKRADGQLIYTVQFHLEKSFQDLTKNLQRVNPNSSPEERKRVLREEASARTLWAHPNESRDGRILFENFLILALEHNRSAGGERRPGA